MRPRVGIQTGTGFKNPVCPGRSGQNKATEGRPAAGTRGRVHRARWVVAQDDPAGGFGGDTRRKSDRENRGRPWTGDCSQRWLTRWSGRRPRCPRALPRPGAARLPCSRGLGPRRGGSAISERTLRRSRAQVPLPPGGGGALRLVVPAQVRALPERGRCVTGTWDKPTALRSAQPSRSLPALRPRAQPTRVDPVLHAGWHSLRSVGAGPGPRPVHSDPRRREPAYQGRGHLRLGRGEDSAHRLRGYFLPATPQYSSPG